MVHADEFGVSTTVPILRGMIGRELGESLPRESCERVRGVSGVGRKYAAQMALCKD